LSPLAANTKITLIEAGRLFADTPVVQDVYSNRVSSLTPTSVQFLKDLGAWGLIDRERKWPYHTMHVWDAVADGAIDFKKSSEPIAHVVENRLLQAALAKVAESLQSVEVFDKEKVESIESFDDRPVLTLASGIQITCDLLIGADGPNSKVREFAGIESVGLNYSQHGLVGTVLIEQCDNKAAWQRFLPSGPIALLPVSAAH
ncbi:putative ubiquinone biosynthesis monooxygenase, partial [Kappamyces sp. JEL0680]